MRRIYEYRVGMNFVPCIGPSRCTPQKSAAGRQSGTKPQNRWPGPEGSRPGPAHQFFGPARPKNKNRPGLKILLARMGRKILDGPMGRADGPGRQSEVGPAHGPLGRAGPHGPASSTLRVGLFPNFFLLLSCQPVPSVFLEFELSTHFPNIRKRMEIELNLTFVVECHSL